MSEEEREERASFEVLTKEKDVQTVQDVIKEAEKALGVNSEANIVESKDRWIPGMDVILVEVGKAFVKAVVDRYGDSFVDWLTRKLKLDEDEGEEVSEKG